MGPIRWRSFVDLACLLVTQATCWFLTALVFAMRVRESNLGTDDSNTLRLLSEAAGAAGAIAFGVVANRFGARISLCISATCTCALAAVPLLGISSSPKSCVALGFFAAGPWVASMVAVDKEFSARLRGVAVGFLFLPLGLLYPLMMRFLSVWWESPRMAFAVAVALTMLALLAWVVPRRDPLVAGPTKHHPYRTAVELPASPTRPKSRTWLRDVSLTALVVAAGAAVWTPVFETDFLKSWNPNATPAGWQLIAAASGPLAIGIAYVWIPRDRRRWVVPAFLAASLVLAVADARTAHGALFAAVSFTLLAAVWTARGADVLDICEGERVGLAAGLCTLAYSGGSLAAQAWYLPSSTLDDVVWVGFVATVVLAIVCAIWRGQAPRDSAPRDDGRGPREVVPLRMGRDALGAPDDGAS